MIMSKKKRKKKKSASSKNQAGKTEFPKASRQEKSRNCPVRPFESENADSIAEEKPSLRIRKTDFEYGF